jgi:hypothetical protein
MKVNEKFYIFSGILKAIHAQSLTFQYYLRKVKLFFFFPVIVYFLFRLLHTYPPLSGIHKVYRGLKSNCCSQLSHVYLIFSSKSRVVLVTHDRIFV